MYFEKQDNCIIARHQNETVKIEAWGTNAVRVRATQYPQFSSDNKACFGKCTD